MNFNGRSFLFVALGCGLSFVPAHGIHAQQAADPSLQARPASGQDQEPDPLKRQRSDEEKFKAQKAVRQELKGAYKTWLDQDVAYIITDEERKAFKNLSNDEEREAFIEQFWLRRNPNPDSPDNEFREEHYRRIRLRQRPLCGGQAGMEDRSRPHLHCLRPAGFDRVSPFGRLLSAPHGRRRRRDIDVPV